MTESYEMHVISHSHWDREWRYGFAETRLYLVEMMDRLLEVLDANPDYRYFHLDGQTILLEDYLEIRPEMEDRLKQHIETGRILVGPWYTLPEEFVVSGESLVRNLLIGHKTAQRFSKVMKVGYTPTSCGQISQLPQIYAGFDIDSIFFYRGLNPDDAKAEFFWEGADGTRALAFHFYSWTRSNFFSVMLYPVLFDGWRDLGFKDVKRHFHLTGQTYPYVHDSVDCLKDFHPGRLWPSLVKVRDDAISKGTTRYLLYMDGCDNGGPIPHTLKIIAEANRLGQSDKYIHSNLSAYVAKVKKAVKGLEVLKGEMRKPGMTAANAAYPGALSARMYLKQLNMRAEFDLAGRAEPWAAIAWLLGQKYPQGQLDRAWKYLIANHAHDSIEACSTDRVHADMEYRFAQCAETAQGVFRRSLGKVASSLPMAPDNELSLILFNPLASERSEVVSAVLDLPVRDKVNVVQYEDSGAVRDDVEAVPEELRFTEFTLLDGNQEVVYEIAEQEDRNVLVERLEVQTHQFAARRFKINFAAEDIPALGYKVFRVVRGPRTAAPKKLLALSADVLENEVLKVKVNDNGTLTVKDKLSGQTYRNLHVFEDIGEVGDSLAHREPAGDKPITNAANEARVSLEYSDHFKAVVRVDVAMKIPVAASADKASRSRRAKSVKITSRLTLCRGSKRLDIVTTLNNEHRDHRLRVLFPTGINAEYSQAAGQFDVVPRPVKGPRGKKEYYEQEVDTHPNYGFVDVSDTKVGLAILNEGLTEYEVSKDRSRTVALTLVRAFADVCGEAAGDDVEQQCLRPFEFRYAIYPHSGDYQAGNVSIQERQYQLPLVCAQSGRGSGEMGDAISFFKLEPASLVLSALKRSESGKSIIMRFFNPNLKTLRAKVSCFSDIKRVWQTNMNEERQKECRPTSKRVASLRVKPKRIVTLEIMLKG